MKIEKISYQTFTGLSSALHFMRWNNKKFGHRIFLIKRKIDKIPVYEAAEYIYKK